jgi:hypothetical protein
MVNPMTREVLCNSKGICRVPSYFRGQMQYLKLYIYPVSKMIKPLMGPNRKWEKQ